MSDNESLRDTFASGPHTDSASDRSGNPPCQDFLRKNLTLTDDERAAVAWAIEVADSLAECSGAGTGGEPSREAATLRALLARLGGGK